MINIKNSLNTINFIYIFINFSALTISYLISSFLREGIKIYFEKIFIKDIITKEKRTKPLLYFFDYLGYFLFILVSIGYSNNRNIKYKNYSFKRKLIFFISGIIIDIVIIFIVYYLQNSNFYFNKFLFVNKLYFYLIYVNFILIIVNTLPLPLSDLLIFFDINSYLYPFFYFIQTIIIFCLYYFKLNIYFYLKFIKYLNFILH